MERKGLVKLASKKSVSQRLNRNVPKRARGRGVNRNGDNAQKFAT